MLLFLCLAAGLWLLGRMLGAPRSARWIMIALLYVAILAITIAFPDTHPLQSLAGGTTAEWLVLGGLVAAVWAYSMGLRQLKSRVRPENQPQNDAARSSETEIERYARHIVLRELGGQGQKRLKEARILVIGAGGLGSPALMYLAAAGVGTIGVIDDDIVTNSNLQRQVIHTDDRIGMPKVFSAQMAMEAQNPFITVKPYNRKLTAEIAEELFAEYDLILDGTDGTDSRYAINAAAVATGTPLISGALSQWEGQISTFAPRDGAPCYQCVFPEPNAPGLAPSCAEGGVLGPLPGVIGTMMAVEAIKELTGTGEGLKGRMMIYDALFAEARVIKLKRRPECSICGGSA
ncbi:HesA/MoeB/ThiF family protein [Ovoidimarina sediminis]|uniref:HesA/MoeB/ThiF family protein n=1 Tax=Ovoidimarina sediminis TaxID=3079856 RepID=UPI0029121EDA|nr:molybdopterin-synthase adenylyltransferase MoeB [Rhodophyticola sp. MJ-SS7]MDU8943716.1 molybdopterin-synthase adenylyltransferase MoeB [Rhodophyticola sp. MJ-SS7]